MKKELTERAKYIILNKNYLTVNPPFLNYQWHQNIVINFSLFKLSKSSL